MLRKDLSSDSPPPLVGQRAPDFSLMSLQGMQIHLGDILRQGPALLVFYRGGWCPLFSSQIAKLSLNAEEFSRRKTSILAISHQPIAKGEDLLRKYAPPFPLVHDVDCDVIKAYGIKFEGARRDVAAWIYRQRDYAVPTCVLIDEGGVIRWIYIGSKANDRPKVKDMLAQIDVLSARLQVDSLLKLA